MNDRLCQEEEWIAKTARDFAERVLAPGAAARDRHGTFPVEELRTLGELGLLGVNVASELGGAQAGAMAYVLVMMEIARVDAAVSIAVGVTNMVAELIGRWGSEAQQQRFVPRVISGHKDSYLCAAFSLSEPQAGSDISAMSTIAARAADGYRLNGTKQWISSGTHAGLFVVWARTDPAAGKRGVSAFLVEKGTPGLTVGKKEAKMGLNGSSTVQLHLEDVLLPMDQRLGEEGQGLKIALSALDGGRIGIAAQAVGIATAALEASCRYAQERVQFGVTLARHQAIALSLAEMATWRDAARLLTLRAAWKKQTGQAFSKEASIAKLYASERAGVICDRAVQIHGGYGYTRDFPVERYFRDARVSRIYEGTSEVQRMVIAREVLKTGAPL